jgi:hypothetical protein
LEECVTAHQKKATQVRSKFDSTFIVCLDSEGILTRSLFPKANCESAVLLSGVEAFKEGGCQKKCPDK